jgi:predicted transcriptional regulator
MNSSKGFLSYVHADDDAENGRIVRLARDVQSQFEMLTGEAISLFLDKDAIEWGDDWRAKIDSGLD